MSAALPIHSRATGSPCAMAHDPVHWRCGDVRGHWIGVVDGRFHPHEAFSHHRVNHPALLLGSAVVPQCQPDRFTNSANALGALSSCCPSVCAADVGGCCILSLSSLVEVVHDTEAFVHSNLTGQMHSGLRLFVNPPSNPTFCLVV